MKAVIIEDEAPAARRLQKLILEADPSITILKVIESVEATLKWINSNPAPDLFFMDIQLADGLSFEIFAKTEIKSPVIFTTAFDEYAIKAFKVNSIDYLLKPVDPQELQQSIQKFHRIRSTYSNEGLTNLQRLLASIDRPLTNYKSRFLIRIGERLVSVDITEILLFKSEDKASFLYTKSGQKFLLDYTLDQLEDMIDPSKFFRVNRQNITHISAIDTIHNYFNGKLKVFVKHKDREEIIVSRERAPYFKLWLGM